VLVAAPPPDFPYDTVTHRERFIPLTRAAESRLNAGFSGVQAGFKRRFAVMTHR
jgi:hypothetical protein